MLGGGRERGALFCFSVEYRKSVIRRQGGTERCAERRGRERKPLRSFNFEYRKSETGGKDRSVEKRGREKRYIGTVLNRESQKSDVKVRRRDGL